MTTQQAHLFERLQRLGFTRGPQMKPYGGAFLSEPIVLTDDVVFVDAEEKKGR